MNATRKERDLHQSRTPEMLKKKCTKAICSASPASPLTESYGGTTNKEMNARVRLAGFRGLTAQTK